MFKRPLSIIILSLVLAATVSCSKTKEAFKDSSNWSVERYYSEAKSRLNKHNFESAIELYQELESKFPYSKYAAQAQIETAYAHYKDDEPELALAAVDRFIRLHPTHDRVDYAYYLKGLVSVIDEKSSFSWLVGGKETSELDPNSTRRAFDAFRDLTTRFPNSRYASDARQRMTYLLNNLAAHDIYVARFYFDRGAYVATVNRAKYVLEHYQHSTAVEDALGLMANAYLRMGVDTLVNDTVRVLESNYPDSSYLNKFKNRKSTKSTQATAPKASEPAKPVAPEITQPVQAAPSKTPEPAQAASTKSIASTQTVTPQTDSQTAESSTAPTTDKASESAEKPKQESTEEVPELYQRPHITIMKTNTPKPTN